MIHETAIIEKGAVIGEDVEIGAYCFIGKDVKIGNGTILKSHVVVEGKTTIGENNIIYPYASIGQDPQDLKYNGEDTELIIGDNNKIREFCTINKGTTASNKTVIGNNNLLMAYVHVAHDVVIGDNCIFANCATLAGHVEVENFAVVGGLTGVHQFCKIGESAMIGGATRIVQDVAPFVTVEGNDAKTRGLNLLGLKRRGFSREDIRNIKTAYKKIFMSKIKLENALNELEIEFKDDKNIIHMIKTIRSFDRGLTR
ncbi:acyl-[acyl-carrier-protein]--UDP-N-acetylglucosamine O-acyltransferase [Hypnocyclicus thermotrophus]|uniref:Acyl-[acyl-carrier-protein]--UDP-N-acetylglucosamine O-acyltransferase n=1 Tax=Hypnocyclicus thermotrophus TaxID=1627895 RepID=A0AA46I684_9FUSO|nr:acyl-ACP--UDP-N-acetylglucosamine O-acyltransferase [Hypnocyclicus thermotrophus]TDT71880.1 acyl-[acyl-carrier-protein]--UDP-N-acetylglucosamine O-acyltransferase [Hypnocyclicus thermotrophus]